MKKFSYTVLFLILFTAQSCGIYSFTGTNLHPDVKTVQIDYFPNNAILVEPGLSQAFTIQFQDLFLQQTNLDLGRGASSRQTPPLPIGSEQLYS